MCFVNNEFDHEFYWKYEDIFGTLRGKKLKLVENNNVFEKNQKLNEVDFSKMKRNSI